MLSIDYRICPLLHTEIKTCFDFTKWFAFHTTCRFQTIRNVEALFLVLHLFRLATNENDQLWNIKSHLKKSQAVCACGPRPHFVRRQWLVKMAMNSILVIFCCTIEWFDKKKPLNTKYVTTKPLFIFFTYLISNEYACENPCMGCGFLLCSFFHPRSLLCPILLHIEKSFINNSFYIWKYISCDAWIE